MNERRNERERRARARELERLMKQLDDADARQGLGAWPPADRSRRTRTNAGTKTRTNTRTTTWLLSGTITVLLLGIIIALHPGPQATAVRRLLGFGEGRIMAAPEVPDGPGDYAFVATQRDGRTPVGYDPCRVIELEINPDDAPDDYRDLVDTATRHISEATGLAFKVVGTTDTRPSGRPDDAKGPALVAWADEGEVSELEGDVAGVAGSRAMGIGNGPMFFVSGAVTLDTEVFSDDDVPRDQLQAIVDHEFGHLVGLDHVDDPRELMYAESVGVTEFGPGDLRGLAEIGRIACR
ncbi:matrixin family metalloprotease [Nocardioides jensenii]|uniref:matrixin family metalloprotease n=1 Tax=Nocardioides jensenii TaxID=1843 RepID=UPI0012FB0C42|nr:matrixin family metalloprotease [Nocardioides jensenii]